jgi:hypothetical protein
MTSQNACGCTCVHCLDGDHPISCRCLPESASTPNPPIITGIRRFANLEGSFVGDVLQAPDA